MYSDVNGSPVGAIELMTAFCVGSSIIHCALVYRSSCGLHLIETSHDLNGGIYLKYFKMQ